MRNITLTFALTALAFSAALNYSLLTFRLGVVSQPPEMESASYDQKDIDYVSQLATARGRE